MTWIAGKFDDRLGSGLHQDGVSIALIGAQHLAQCVGHGDDDMEIPARQHFGLTSLQPAFGLVGMTFGAAPVFAGVIGEDLGVAFVATPDVSAERLGAAGHDVVDGAPMRWQHRRAMGREVVRREAAEDVRDLDHGQAAASEAAHQSVENATQRDACWFSQVGVDGGGGDVRVTEQDLHDAGVDALFKQPSGEAMTQGMRRYVALDARQAGGAAERGSEHMLADGLSAVARGKQPVTQPDGTGRTDLTDPHAYGRIDVIRGPSSAVYGNYATGGAINFITRHGGDIQGIEFGTDAGSFGYLNNYATAGWSGKGFEASIFASNVRGDGFIGNSRFDTATVNALASIDVTENDRLTIKIIQNSLDTFLPIRLSLNQYNQNPYQKNCSNPSVAGCATVTLFNNGRNGATTRLTASQAGLGRFDSRSIVGVRWEHTFDADTVWRTQMVFDDRNIKQPTNSTSSVGPFTSVNIISDVTRRGSLLGLESTFSIGMDFNEERLNSYTYNLLPTGGHTQGSQTQTVFGNVTNVGGRIREEIALTPKLAAVFALGSLSVILCAGHNQRQGGVLCRAEPKVSTVP